MAEKFDFEEISKDAVEHEPERKQGLGGAEEKETVKNGSETVFEADAKFIIPSLMQGLDGLWSYLWGKGEGASLNDTEKNGIESLFSRGADHFGMIRYMDGAKGFFIELLLKAVGITLPRLSDEKAMEHAKTVLNGSETVSKTVNQEEKGEKEDVNRTTVQSGTSEERAATGTAKSLISS